MITKGKFVSEPIGLTLGPKGLQFDRADIQITGIEQAGPSFEGRVFLNNPKADMETPRTEDHGYAGSFYVYGYGLWSPDGPGAPSPTGKAERAPIQKTVIATDAVRAAAEHSRELTVTVVPVFTGDKPGDAADALTVESVKILVS